MLLLVKRKIEEEKKTTDYEERYPVNNWTEVKIRKKNRGLGLVFVLSIEYLETLGQTISNKFDLFFFVKPSAPIYF